ncbi:hypothetical protein FRC10_008392 [Ceratobasidium sp. 414]|nr:hypothetical protein FRC10_008392 [Ceratobasidium sp. 414]
MSSDKHSLASPPGPSVKRFLLSTYVNSTTLDLHEKLISSVAFCFFPTSSDVLEGGQKVYIKDEKTGDTKWCKTRILAHKEIIDEIRTPEPSNALKYTIHRPTRGWYIHIRAATAAPLALTPNPLADPDRTDADCELMIQLPMGLRYKGKEREVERARGLGDQDEWSFPPTPPIRSPPRRAPLKEPESASTSPSTSTHTDPLRSPSPPPSSTSITSKLAPRVPPPPMPTIPLIFAPLPPPVFPQKQPVLSRAYASGILRILANTLFSPPRRSFALSTRLPATPDQREHESIPTPAIEAGPAGMGGPVIPVLTYTDTTPVLAVSRMTGVLSLDMGLLGTMLMGGVEETREDENGAEWEEEIGLLVAAVLGYLDFLNDREGYIAAANGG